MEKKERFYKQQNLVEGFLNCESEEQALSLLKLNRDLVDSEVASILRERTMGLLPSEQYDKIARMAMVIDAIEESIGIVPDCQFHIAGYYLEKHKFPQAEKIIRRITSGKSKDELSFWLSHCLLQQGKTEEGKQILKDFLTNNPNNVDAHIYLGNTYIVEKNWTAAKNHIETALKIDPDNLMAKQAIQAIPPAIITYDSNSGTLNIDSTPEYAEVAYIVGIIAANPNRMIEVLETIAEKMGKEVAQMVKYLYHANFGSENQSKGKSHFEKAEEYFMCGKFEEAIDEYKKAVKEDQNDSLAYMGLGDAYYRTGNFRLAAAYFEESIAIQESAPTFRYLGDAYVKVGDLDKAIKAYQKSVETDPNYLPAKASLLQAMDLKQENE